MDDIKTVEVFFHRQPDQGRKQNREEHSKLDAHEPNRLIDKTVGVFCPVIGFHKGSISQGNGKEEYDDYSELKVTEEEFNLPVG